MSKKRKKKRYGLVLPPKVSPTEKVLSEMDKTIHTAETDKQTALIEIAEEVVEEKIQNAQDKFHNSGTKKKRKNLGKKKKVTQEVIEDARKERERYYTLDFRKDLSKAICLRHPLIYLEAVDDGRLVSYCSLWVKSGEYDVYVWDCLRGFNEVFLSKSKYLLKNHYLQPCDLTEVPTKHTVIDPIEALDYVIAEGKVYQHKRTAVAEMQAEGKRGTIFILLDHQAFEPLNHEVTRRLKEIAYMNTVVSTIIVSPVAFQNLENIGVYVPVLKAPRLLTRERREIITGIADGVSFQIEGIREQAAEIIDYIVPMFEGYSRMEISHILSKVTIEHQKWETGEIQEAIQNFKYRRF